MEDPLTCLSQSRGIRAPHSENSLLHRSPHRQQKGSSLPSYLLSLPHRIQKRTAFNLQSQSHRRIESRHLRLNQPLRRVDILI